MTYWHRFIIKTLYSVQSLVPVYCICRFVLKEKQLTYNIVRSKKFLSIMSVLFCLNNVNISVFFPSPATAPTSYEGSYGKIMYKIRAFIDTPRFSKDYKTEKPFYMLNNVNLNDVPEIYVSV